MPRVAFALKTATTAASQRSPTAPVPKYNILKRDKLMEGAKLAAERGTRL